MAAEDREDITIENNVATWNIEATGDIHGLYTGTFKFKCYLDPIEQIRANKEYRDLLGANLYAVPEHESWLAYALTQLKYRVISAPPFWTSTSGVSGVSGNLPDENIITEVLNAATDSEIKYRNILKKRKESALERAKAAAEKMVREQQAEDFSEKKDESQS
jgi:hypothetical protein